MIVFVPLLVLFFLGVGAAIIFGRSKLKKLAIVFGAVVLGLVATIATFRSLIEWNPYVDETLIIGTWKDARETVTLRSDHTVDYSSDTEGFKGKWSRQDWNLRLKAQDVDTTMRFITFAGTLRLLSNPRDDSDSWDFDLGLSKQNR